MPEKFQFNWPVIGHEKIKKILQSSIASKSLAHAYLFHGPEKVGKTHLAEIFAASIICENFSRGSQNSILPCGQCDPCRQFGKRIYPDLYFVERQNNEKGEKRADIRVEQIRELIEKISKRAFLNNYKFVIISEAQYLNPAASNCLLKTLEEPTAQTVIILICPAVSRLLPTIKSRCQSFKFLSVSKNLIYDYLIKKGANRNLSVELASIAAGRPSVAMQYFVAPDKRAEFLASSRGWLSVFNQSALEKFKFVENFIKNNENNDVIIEKLSDFSVITRDIMLARVYKNELIVNAPLEKEISEIADKFDFDSLNWLIAEIEKTKIRIRQNVNPKLTLENLLLNM